MLALWFEESEISIRDVPVPDLEPGEALVRVRSAGVCSTDIEITRGYMKFNGILGHEFVGEVCAPENHPLIGRRVVGEINCGCGHCPACKDGLERHCPNRSVLGILGRQGAFAEFLSLPSKNLYVVPDHIDDEVAVFTEPIAACFEVLEQCPELSGGHVLVMGDGRLGLLQAQVLKAAGASVTILGRHSRKLAILEGVGITTVTESSNLLAPSNEGWPAVVEATGSKDGFEMALSLLAPRGSLILKSTVAEPSMVHLAPLVINEISVIGSRCGPFPPALKALSESMFRIAPMIDARFSLSEGVQALERAQKKGTLKVIISP
ncbi:MAG: alcohol dehydrogenase catalytic domain-containing protein [Nitrospinaceae bacterium]|nr:alcohol dehydrogenase catalytic domain-containing protein [Nitrospinaceae bacterium]MBT3435623.1 alcohol dehydrogenase catalytic domain-containing protein [Nitrospinaceae bacterium]MBT3819865.1 alcohol dehydrogenase catalytic domain-containing protein [Nitrospinaceae bacterium]MBT4092777.1 alcohol dehydrogenase catalytic domain-containing protein [Nitrospinaceae bacterium]MBT4431250.1 alcohol dehydrogenase catalytic domain-containing protein [Nitrospinaceae bacterium]